MSFFMFNRVGYCCINHTLSLDGIHTNRTMRKATFQTKGLEAVEDLIIKNLDDLQAIFDWNVLNGFQLFRLSSDMFPWKSEWTWTDLPNWTTIENKLSKLGAFAKQHNFRLTMHPGPFNKLASDKPGIVQATIRELIDHAEVLDLLGQPQDHRAVINIHVGGIYEGKDKALARFIQNFKLLPTIVKNRLTVENDDRPGFYSTAELYNGLYKEIAIPIVFDFYHHRVYSSVLPFQFRSSLQDVPWWSILQEQQALQQALSTWPDRITPLTHWSESRRIEQNDFKLSVTAHSDLVTGPFPPYMYTKNWRMANTQPHYVFDVDIEAKLKERAAQNFIKLHAKTLMEMDSNYNTILS